MESQSALEKILQYYRQDHKKFYRIPENTIKSYRILNKLLWNPQQDKFPVVILAKILTKIP